MLMRCVLTIGVSLFMTLSLIADEAAEAEKKEAIVYDGLADLILLRDSVLSRYALMVTGETTTLSAESVNRPPIAINRIYKLHAGNKAKNFNYRAHGKVMGPGSSNRSFEFQYWVEFFQCGEKLKGRAGSADTHGYSQREKGQTVARFIGENRLSFVSFDPFDDLVLHAMFLQNEMLQRGWIEKVYLQESKFLSAEEVTQGDIVSKWHWRQHTLAFDIELTQSKAYGYMPTQVKYTSTNPNMPDRFGETNIKWKKNLKLSEWLPHVVKAAAGSSRGGAEVHHHWVFDWRVGDELDDKFFDCESTDFRLQFSPLYDFYFDTHAQPGGLFTGTPWRTPEELQPTNGLGKGQTRKN
ncbi:hypothetical protein [Rubripirellula reticaptiva]|uniref:Uncharacterized protein n=1 Tax=Rubripirellula reticaptiva TaxID=2528013 RepID=A0A5C6F7U6_9BACT|nr:hypothetical protein [Rubripirellula reticaptiva]TWU57335.1 hypothetical protein Poly59_02420 [Rubripirellula reticaptiva]